MVGAGILFGLFDSVDIERLFNYENSGFVAFGIVVKFGDLGISVNESKGDGAIFDAGMQNA